MDVITSMINLDPEKRPSASELLDHPQIDVRCKEKKLKEYYMILKKKEAEIVKQETEMNDKENALNQRLKELSEKEERLNMLEKKLEDQETQIKYQTQYRY